MSLPGLSAEEFALTLFSVDPKRRRNRPLSPTEVARNFEKALDTGLTLDVLAKAVGLTEGMVKQILQLMELHPDVLALVDWGMSKEGLLGFSSAREAVRLLPQDEQMDLAVDGCMTHSLTKSETKSVAQLRQRSGQSLRNCIERVVNRRSQRVHREVVISSVSSSELKTKLDELTQKERDELLKRAVSVRYPEVSNVAIRLAPNYFALMGEHEVREHILSDNDWANNINESLIELISSEGRPSPERQV